MFKTFIITAFVLAIAYGNGSSGSDNWNYTQVPSSDVHDDSNILKLFEYGSEAVVKIVLKDKCIDDLDFDADVWYIGKYSQNGDKYTKFEAMLNNSIGVDLNVTFVVKETSSNKWSLNSYKYKGTYSSEAQAMMKNCTNGEEQWEEDAGNVDVEVENWWTEEQNGSGGNTGVEVEVETETEDCWEEEEEHNSSGGNTGVEVEVEVETEDCEEEEEHNSSGGNTGVEVEVEVEVETEDCWEEEEEHNSSGGNTGVEVEVEVETEDCEEEEEHNSSGGNTGVEVEVEVETEDCEEEEEHNSSGGNTGVEVEVEVEVETEDCWEEEEHKGKNH